MGREGNRSGTGQRLVALVAIGLLAALAVFAGCGDDGDSTSGSVETGEPRKLAVLVYNVEYSGDETTDAVIRDVDADVVGVLESYQRLPEMAKRTGYPYYNSSLQILSKYPILEPSGAEGLYALIEVEPGYVVPFFNEHLDYVAWGPGRLERGRSIEEVLATEEEVRVASLERPMESMKRLIDDGYPVLLTGDFNEPSSLDYGEETVGTRKGIDEPIPWPVSEELLALGFSDSYREAHEDPVADPGVTHARTDSRIDYVYAAGPARTLGSKLVGERGGEGVDVAEMPWTSDHRAVLSTFEVTPVAMPALVAVDERLASVGDDVGIAWNVPDAGGNELSVVAEGDAAGDALETIPAPDPRGSTSLDTKGWQPGSYEAILGAGEGDEVARVSFYLRDPEAAIDLTTARKAYDRGEPIEVSWTGGPANRWDWLGVFPADDADPEKGGFTIWDYAEGHSSGTVPPRTVGEAELGPGSQGSPWPLPPGDYVVHYLIADQYESAGSAEFSVRAGG